jgi:hypothetical protein
MAWDVQGASCVLCHEVKSVSALPCEVSTTRFEMERRLLGASDARELSIGAGSSRGIGFFMPEAPTTLASSRSPLVWDSCPAAAAVARACMGAPGGGATVGAGRQLARRNAIHMRELQLWASSLPSTTGCNLSTCRPRHTNTNGQDC